ncbi:MAG TPA: hypothetical protein PL072_09840 [Phycisphaerales bacterium]|nr:hypothetical protein [Phycisphaerales bacterium]
MTVGIPGTGLGGLFYLGLALGMPVREAALTVRGRSSWRRWKFIIRQWLLVAGMLGLMAGQAWVLKRGAAWVVSQFPKSEVSHDLQTVVSSSSGLATTGAWLTLSILIAIVLLVQMARLGVMLADRRERRGPVVAG